MIFFRNVADRFRSFVAFFRDKNPYMSKDWINAHTYERGKQ